MPDWTKAASPLTRRPWLGGAGGGRARRKFFWRRTFTNAGAARVDKKHSLSAEKAGVLLRVRTRYDAWWKEMEAAEPRGPFRDY